MTAAAAKRHSKTVGYIRVSSLDQNTERQLDGLKLDKVFTDKASGKDTKRP
jgi:DNA invertase Pin-like site-specific DNA recombinase